MLKPNDIIVPEFSKVIAGGYKPAEVKAFVDQLISDYSDLYDAYTKRESELRETALQLKEVSEHYYDLSKESTKAAPADAIGAELIDNATKEAARIVEEANTRAAEVYNSSLERTKLACNDILAKYTEAFENEKAMFVALHTAYSEFVARITDACRAQADSISTNSVNIDIEAVKAIDFKSELRAAITKKSDDGTKAE